MHDMTTRSPRRTLSYALGAAVLAALAVACGGGGSSDAGSVQAPAAVASAPSAQTAPASTPAATATATATAVPTLGGCDLFPANAIFNTRIDDAARFPVHPDSARWIALAGPSLNFSADWGTNANPAAYQSYWGLPVNVIDDAGSDWPLVSFDFSASGLSSQSGYPAQSDCAAADGSGFTIARDCTTLLPSQRRFPFPRDASLLAEGGACTDPGCGDRHVLVLEQGACRLWESYFSYELGGRWYSLATAAWDLHSLALRPDGEASADASGLPITPLLVKAAEANAGEIRHALRVTFRDPALALQHVWPARFAAGNDDPGAIPFGALLRLKADFAIPANWTTQAKAIATAAKRYGLYVADNGADFYVQGEPDAAWDPATLQQLKSIALGDMEFVDLGTVTSDPRFSRDSMAASW
jgi:hypothetical protein